MKKESDDQINSRISKKDKEILKAIKKSDDKITPRYILESFIQDYCSTKPQGIKIKIKEVEHEIKELENYINSLQEDKTKLEIKLKTYQDQLNKKLDDYIDENLIKAIDSVSETSKQKNIELFEDIPEVTFINIAKYNKIELKTLKDEVKKAF